MTLREALGRDVRKVHEQVDALLDREDGVLALFDGGRVVTYATGFGVSASQLELLGVALERALRDGVGRAGARRAPKRRNHESDPGPRSDAGVDGSRDGAVGRVLHLARKIA